MSTPLGKRINDASQQSGLAKIGNPVSKNGTIVECIGDSYSYMVKLDGSDVPIGPIELDGRPEQHAANGVETKLTVGSKVRIQYTGTSAKRGVMTLIADSGLVPGLKYENAKAANELAVKGTAFAPPGAGV